MMAKKVMELANYNICSLSAVSSFIGQKNYLTWKGLAIDTKQATLRGVKKKIGPDWSGLDGI